MSYNHVHVSHVRNDDQYPLPGSGYPGPGGFNPGPPPPPPGNFLPPPPQPPGYPGGGRWDQDRYQGYFDHGYPPPSPRPLPPHHYGHHYQQPYEYGCDSFLRRCLGFLCCCWLLEAYCF